MIKRDDLCLLKSYDSFQICKMGLRTEWKHCSLEKFLGIRTSVDPWGKVAGGTKRLLLLGPTKDINSVRDLLVYPQEKYDENVIPWVGVSYKGLVPSRNPVFVVEMNAHRCTNLQLCLSLLWFSRCWRN